MTDGAGFDVPKTPLVEKISLRYVLTPQIEWDAKRSLIRDQLSPAVRIAVGLIRVILVLLCLLCVWIIFRHWKSGGPFDRPTLVLALSMGTLAGAGPQVHGIAFRFISRRRLARKPEKERWVEWSIGPDEVELRSHSIESKLKWSAFTRVVEHAEGLLFFISFEPGDLAARPGYPRGIERVLHHGLLAARREEIRD